MRWQQYLQSLAYSRIKVSNPNIGVVYSYARDIYENQLFLSPVDSSEIRVGEVLKVQFLDSKLKDVIFIIRVKRTLENKLEGELSEYEKDYNRYPLSALQEDWEKINKR